MYETARAGKCVRGVGQESSATFTLCIRRLHSHGTGWKVFGVGLKAESQTKAHPTRRRVL